MYVVIEGIDTAGKSTQIDLLKKIYSDAIFTKEPGGTEVGQEVRRMILDGGVSSPIAEIFLFLADRAEHFRKVIEPNKDALIISDRSFISGISYPISLDVAKLFELNMMALENNKPDLVVVLELEEKELIYRLSLKEHDKIEQRGIEYLINIQTNMKNILSQLNIKHIVINASNDISKINKIICNEISSLHYTG